MPPQRILSRSYLWYVCQHHSKVEKRLETASLRPYYFRKWLINSHEKISLFSFVLMLIGIVAIHDFRHFLHHMEIELFVLEKPLESLCLLHEAILSHLLEQVRKDVLNKHIGV